MEYVVTWGLLHRTLAPIRAIGVDEIQYAKGQKYLTLVYQILDEWLERAGISSGAVFRPLNKGGRMLDGRISEDTVWNVVRDYGARLGKKGFAPHDLRRTCARLCRVSGGDLEQIQLLLGHASVQTTERYLGTGRI